MLSVSHNRAMDSWLALAKYSQSLLACNSLPLGAASKGAFQHFRCHSLPKSASNSLACNRRKAFSTITLEAKTFWAGQAWMMQSLSCAWFMFALGRFPSHLLKGRVNKNAQRLTQ